MVGDNNTAIVKDSEGCKIETNIISSTRGRIEVALTDVGLCVWSHAFAVVSDMEHGVNIRPVAALVPDIKDE